MSTDKKVLVIVYDFPPYSGGGAALRTVKFVRYLPEFGWSPKVLTAKKPDSLLADQTLLDQIPRTPLYQIKDLYYSLFKDIQDPNITKKPMLRLCKKIIRRACHIIKGFCDKYLFIPDTHLLWLFPAFFKGLLLIKKDNIEVIYSTSPPHTPHILGYLLSKATGIKTVVDFRDGWSENPYYSSMSGFRLKLEKKMESLVVNNASAVITTSPALTKSLQSRYGKELKAKTIYNGYDEADFTGFEYLEPVDKHLFTLSYVGSLDGKRIVNNFLNAFSQLKDKNLRLKFVGHLSHLNKTLIAESNEDIVVMGKVSHHKAVQEMLAADILISFLFPDEDGNRAIPGKIFEYLRAGKPILAIAPKNGEFARFISSNDLGEVADPFDESEIQDKIQLLFYKWYNGQLDQPSDNFVSNFSRKQLTKKLAAIFDDLI